MNTVQKFWNQIDNNNKPTLFLTLKELKTSRSIPTQKRGNPKQRKKRKQQQAVQLQSHQPQTTMPTNTKKKTDDNNAHPIATGSSNKTSKYRDASGKRKRKRF